VLKGPTLEASCPEDYLFSLMLANTSGQENCAGSFRDRFMRDVALSDCHMSKLPETDFPKLDSSTTCREVPHFVASSYRRNSRRVWYDRKVVRSGVTYDYFYFTAPLKEVLSRITGERKPMRHDPLHWNCWTFVEEATAPNDNKAVTAADGGKAATVAEDGKAVTAADDGMAAAVADDGMEYVLEKVYAHHGHGKLMHFFVKYIGYPDLSWQPLRNFVTDDLVNEVLLAYLRKKCLLKAVGLKDHDTYNTSDDDEDWN